ncbi:hypothetical protein E2C01_082615 [Portunus trituberculatus]|uniref:Uncharacterized protein n=1 Tax=Portunus trituberculatus TaxID=210409 RepID=A0A5B7IV15_PORTR|nr:hypothetical protein [Portunus trituberculatus]
MFSVSFPSSISLLTALSLVLVSLPEAKFLPSEPSTVTHSCIGDERILVGGTGKAGG